MYFKTQGLLRNKKVSNGVDIYYNTSDMYDVDIEAIDKSVPHIQYYIDVYLKHEEYLKNYKFTLSNKLPFSKNDIKQILDIILCTYLIVHDLRSSIYNSRYSELESVYSKFNDLCRTYCCSYSVGELLRSIKSQSNAVIHKCNELLYQSIKDVHFSHPDLYYYGDYKDYTSDYYLNIKHYLIRYDINYLDDNIENATHYIEDMVKTNRYKTCLTSKDYWMIATYLSDKTERYSTGFPFGDFLTIKFTLRNICIVDNMVSHIGIKHVCDSEIYGKYVEMKNCFFKLDEFDIRYKSYTQQMVSVIFDDMITELNNIRVNKRVIDSKNTNGHNNKKEQTKNEVPLDVKSEMIVVDDVDTIKTENISFIDMLKMKLSILISILHKQKEVQCGNPECRIHVKYNICDLKSSGGYSLNGKHIPVKAIICSQCNSWITIYPKKLQHICGANLYDYSAIDKGI